MILPINKAQQKRKKTIRIGSKNSNNNNNTRPLKGNFFSPCSMVKQINDEQNEENISGTQKQQQQQQKTIKMQSRFDTFDMKFA